MSRPRHSNLQAVIRGAASKQTVNTGYSQGIDVTDHVAEAAKAVQPVTDLGREDAGPSPGTRPSSPDLYQGELPQHFSLSRF
jgi:hypothetical protein